MDLVERLNAAQASTPTQQLKLEAVWGDRPEVLASVLDAYRRGVSVRAIALMLSEEHEVHPDTVSKWLRRQGVA